MAEVALVVWEEEEEASWIVVVLGECSEVDVVEIEVVLEEAGVWIEVDLEAVVEEVAGEEDLEAHLDLSWSKWEVAAEVAGVEDQEKWTSKYGINWSLLNGPDSRMWLDLRSNL